MPSKPFIEYEQVVRTYRTRYGDAIEGIVSVQLVLNQARLDASLSDILIFKVNWA